VSAVDIKVRMHSAEPIAAPDILERARHCIASRAAERDTEAERSMGRAAAMFNAWRGAHCPADLTEVDGWVFMALLKLSRARGGSHQLDDYIDGAAYIALAGEAAEQAARTPI